MGLKPLWVLHDSLFRSAQINPEKTALIAENKAYTYAQIAQDVQRIASAFREIGLQRGDRVALYLDNTYANVISIYATLLAGGAFIPINPQTKPDKLAYVLDNSSARIIVTDTHLFPKLAPISENLKHLSGLIYSDSSSSELAARQIHPQAIPLSEILNTRESSSIPVGVIPNDLAALIYTSGSTGNPKGVMMSHQAMLFAAESISYYLRLDETHRIINVLPMAFDYGLYQILISILCGATLILERSFTYPAMIFQLINDHAVTVLPGVPTIYATIIGMHRRKPLLFPTVKRITNTAASLPAEYNKELREIFPNALIYRMYGLTECKRVCYLEPELAGKKPSSVGKAIPGTEAFILAPDGSRCHANEKGVLHVRGPHLMMGYWNEPELSAKMLKSGEYPGERILCTQDWFRMDEDGDLYFVGRSDDIIKSRGEKISPVEVENVLLSMKGIREAGVIGVADELLGQAVKAFIALDDPDLTEQMIKKHCAENLENFMVPKYFEFVEALPKTESGKITKKNLK